VKETVVIFLDVTFGLSEKSQDIGLGQMAARAALMYVVLLVIVRAAKSASSAEPPPSMSF
jgi:hypothetical protein